MADTMKTTSQTSVVSGRRPLNDHEATRTRYNAWSQQWWNNNFREGKSDDFVVAAVLAGFRREVKLSYGLGLFDGFILEDMATDIIIDSVDHIPVLTEEIRNIPANRIDQDERAVEVNFEYKAATFGTFHASDDNTSDNTCPAKRTHRVSRDKPDNTKPKLQSESLLRRGELDSGDEDTSEKSARISRSEERRVGKECPV